MVEEFGVEDFKDRDVLEVVEAEMESRCAESVSRNAVAGILFS